jgi:hypothetical protein
MASAWGNSWGAYWGNSWGSIASADVVKTGGKGDNGRDRAARHTFKPTGLLDRKRLNPTSNPIVDARIEQSIEIAREIAAENAQRQQDQITAEQQERILRTLNIQLQDARAINREVAAILAEARRRGIEEDEIIVLLLAGSL